MEIVETPLFTRLLQEMLADNEYRQMQAFLIRRPDAGLVIPGSGGLRKLRWSVEKKSRGKRGGARVIYKWFRDEHRLFLVTMYEKSAQENLTNEQLKALRTFLEE